jgi:hypothetical protein
VGAARGFPLTFRRALVRLPMPQAASLLGLRLWLPNHSSSSALAFLAGSASSSSAASSAAGASSAGALRLRCLGAPLAYVSTAGGRGGAGERCEPQNPRG